MLKVSRKASVGIVDYGAGNIQSIENAFLNLGARVLRIMDAKSFSECSHVVLPGVGAFGFCADRLQVSGLTNQLHKWAFQDRKPLLGICVGMQLLAERSEESPEVSGLGWIGGSVKKIAPRQGVRVPHVGWNTIEFTNPYGDFQLGSKADFYFDHSFAYFDPPDGVSLAKCTHGVSFDAAVRRDNIVAAQFHPEKSQAAGMRFLKGFLSN